MLSDLRVNGLKKWPLRFKDELTVAFDLAALGMVGSLDNVNERGETAVRKLAVRVASFSLNGELLGVQPPGWECVYYSKQTRRTEYQMYCWQPLCPYCTSFRLGRIALKFLFLRRNVRLQFASCDAPKGLTDVRAEVARIETREDVDHPAGWFTTLFSTAQGLSGRIVLLSAEGKRLEAGEVDKQRPASPTPEDPLLLDWRRGALNELFRFGQLCHGSVLGVQHVKAFDLTLAANVRRSNLRGPVRGISVTQLERFNQSFQFDEAFIRDNYRRLGRGPDKRQRALRGPRKTADAL